MKSTGVWAGFNHVFLPFPNTCCAVLDFWMYSFRHSLLSIHFWALWNLIVSQNTNVQNQNTDMIQLSDKTVPSHMPVCCGVCMMTGNVRLHITLQLQCANFTTNTEPTVCFTALHEVDLDKNNNLSRSSQHCIFDRDKNMQLCLIFQNRVRSQRAVAMSHVKCGFFKKKKVSY